MKKTLCAILVLLSVILVSCDKPGNSYVTPNSYTPRENVKSTTKKQKETPIETPKAQCDVIQAIVRPATTSYGSKYLIVEYGIKNTGDVNLYMDGDQFDVISPDGSLLDVISYIHTFPTVIAPGETSYITGMATSVDYDTTGVTVEPHFDVSRATIARQRLDVTNTSISESRNGATVKGFVENTTDEDGFVYVYVLLFNKKGDLIGSESTSPDVAPGQKKGFEVDVVIYGYTYEDIDHYEVVSEPLCYQF